ARAVHGAGRQDDAGGQRPAGRRLRGEAGPAAGGLGAAGAGAGRRGDGRRARRVPDVAAGQEAQTGPEEGPGPAAEERPGAARETGPRGDGAGGRTGSAQGGGVTVAAARRPGGRLGGEGRGGSEPAGEGTELEKPPPGRGEVLPEAGDQAEAPRA